MLPPRLLLTALVIGSAASMLTACQSTTASSKSAASPDAVASKEVRQTNSSDFAADTHRTYNPQTGDFEQNPPWGKRSNKTE